LKRRPGPLRGGFELLNLRVDHLLACCGGRFSYEFIYNLAGDFDLAEEAMHEAFASAIEQWPRDGVPANRRTWLVSAGRFKAIDAIRRRSLFDASLAEIDNRLERIAASNTQRDEDDHLQNQENRECNWQYNEDGCDSVAKGGPTCLRWLRFSSRYR